MTSTSNNQIFVRESGKKLILQTATVSSVRNYIEADEKLYLNGDGGDTYFMFNSSSNRLELWVNGAKQNEWG